MKKREKRRVISTNASDRLSGALKCINVKAAQREECDKVERESIPYEYVDVVVCGAERESVSTWPQQSNVCENTEK